MIEQDVLPYKLALTNEKLTPHAGGVEFISACRRRMPLGKRIAEVRSDSAFYNYEDTDYPSTISIAGFGRPYPTTTFRARQPQGQADREPRVQPEGQAREQGPRSPPSLVDPPRTPLL